MDDKRFYVKLRRNFLLSRVNLVILHQQTRAVVKKQKEIIQKRRMKPNNDTEICCGVNDKEQVPPL